MPGDVPTDNPRNRLTLSPTGQPLASWETIGFGQGHFEAPLGIALDSQGNVYVADRVLSKVQKYSPSGQVMAEWGPGAPYNFAGSTPFGVAADLQGNTYITDREASRILKVSPSGEVIATFK